MNSAVAVVVIAVIAGLAIVMLGAVQTARTRKMTRTQLDRAISDSGPLHAPGSLADSGDDEALATLAELRRTANAQAEAQADAQADAEPPATS